MSAAKKARCELAVRKIFISGLTWDDVEKYLNINQRILRSELEEYMEQKPNYAERMEKLEKRILLNGALKCNGC